MVDVLKVDQEAKVAELKVQGGCPICGSDVVVKTTAGRGFSHCPACRRISPSTLTVTPLGLQILQPVRAVA